MKKFLRKKILKSSCIEIDGVVFNLLQKRIKNLHLRIYPPHGEVRISAPLRLDLVAIKKFISTKISWIKTQQIKIKNRKRAEPLKFISGESHYFFGKKYVLQIFENSKKNIVIINGDEIEIHGKKNLDFKKRQKLLDEFYRNELKKLVPQLIFQYEKIMQVKVSHFGIKKMTTRWGTCNIKAKRIWINLELAKKRVECLEFIVVHEMTHLLERKHSKKFFAFMDKFMPNWQVWKGELKTSSTFLA